MKRLRAIVAPFRGFRARLVIVFVGLFALIQAVGFGVVTWWIRADARDHVRDELRLASALFSRHLEFSGQQLLAATRLLAGDFALKTTAATADHDTTRSVLENHRRRIGADLLMLVALDGSVVADTRHADRHGAPFPARLLLEQAEDAGELSRIVALDGTLYRLAVVLLHAPVPIAWLSAGFVIDDRAAHDLRALTGLHVSFVRPEAGTLAVHASTLDHGARETLRAGLEAARRSGEIELGGSSHVLLAQAVGGDVAVVLQRPLADALAPYDRLRGILLVVALAGLLCALAGTAVVARRVSRPVMALAAAARRVAAGDFSAGVHVAQGDELGELGRTFNEMMAGLRERDRVRRDLERAEGLKRFFSPQLAEILASGDDTVLRSHRREITVVFCDLRGFTSFAETADPEDVTRLLDEYHATIGPLVFEHEGTLERFTGDGLMVFFNDPVPCPDPAPRAVRMAIAMRDAVADRIEHWRRRGHRLGFGVGIAMGYATVGRIGFEGRFDYAAIGTVTNLSARLCQEAQDGQILVSSRVHAEVDHLVDSRPLGAVALRGFGRPIEIFDVLRLRSREEPRGAPERIAVEDIRRSE
jgi:adenylate cyclase